MLNVLVLRQQYVNISVLVEQHKEDKQQRYTA